MSNSNRLLCLVGPTATGKSEVAANLAFRLRGEIISADSMQVYKGMDIGTAKPGRALLALAPHHLIGIVHPCESYSVARFQQQARRLIAEIEGRGATPIIVGGSGLYVRAAIDPLDFPAAEPTSTLRLELERIAATDHQALVDKLREVDPSAVDSLDLQNRRRVIRAIEAASVSGVSCASRRRRWRRREAVCDTTIIGLRLSREKLYTSIESRVDAMITGGLEEEVKKLWSDRKGLSATASQALGYKEFIEYFEGRLGYDEAVKLIKRRTRRFAKRQMTWFKADPRITWIDVGDQAVGDIVSIIVKLVRSRDFIVS